MTLTRKERESLVIDLLNKCTPIREIAREAGLSLAFVKKRSNIRCIFKAAEGKYHVLILPE